MSQCAFLLVLQYMADVPDLSRFLHVPDWQLGNFAYIYLMMSTAAWSPTRPAMHRIALRLLLRCGTVDAEGHHEATSRLNRQLFRALRPAVTFDPFSTATVHVRRLARLHVIERDVLRQLLRRRPELQGLAVQLRQAVEQRAVEDVSSEDEQ